MALPNPFGQYGGRPEVVSTRRVENRAETVKENKVRARKCAALPAFLCSRTGEAGSRSQAGRRKPLAVLQCK
jgi:hypothetical protein